MTGHGAIPGLLDRLVISRNEARALMGLEPIDGWDDIVRKTETHRIDGPPIVRTEVVASPRPPRPRRP